MRSADCLPLSEVPEAIPVLARWFKAEWSDYYAGRSLAEVEQDFPLCGQDALPLILVARRDGAWCGTAALRDRSIHAFDHLTPWLGGLFVEPSSRRSGVAGALIDAVAEVARRRGATRLYAGTVEAHALFEDLGWERIGDAAQDGRPVAVYARPL